MQISITGQALVRLQTFKKGLEAKEGCALTWNYIINRLLESHVENKALVSKIASRDAKIDEMHNKTEDYLRLALARPTAPVMAMQQNNSPSLPPPPPSLVIEAAPPPPKQLPPPKNMSGLGQSMIKEMRELFGNNEDGFPSPSKIAERAGTNNTRIVEVELEE